MRLLAPAACCGLLLRHGHVQAIAFTQCASLATWYTPGTAYMHSRGVAHRDLSLENMLVAGSNVGKIIDFGLCVDMPRTALGRFAPVPPGAVGKLFYMAPEVRAGCCGR